MEYNFFRKRLIYTLELSQKSDFQPFTTKPDKKYHPTVKNRTKLAFQVFSKVVFYFVRIKNIRI